MNTNIPVLVKALLKLIAEHLTDDTTDVFRWMVITSTFEELIPAHQQFVLENIYIPKDKQHKCDMSQMAQVRDALRVRASL